MNLIIKLVGQLVHVHRAKGRMWHATVFANYLKWKCSRRVKPLENWQQRNVIQFLFRDVSFWPFRFFSPASATHRRQCHPPPPPPKKQQPEKGRKNRQPFAGRRRYLWLLSFRFVLLFWPGQDNRAHSSSGSFACGAHETAERLLLHCKTCM